MWAIRVKDNNKCIVNIAQKCRIIYAHQITAELPYEAVPLKSGFFRDGHFLDENKTAM